MTFRPRIRTIKPEMWADEKVGQLSRDARLLFVGLITMADDEGRLRGMPAGILGHVFPYDVDALRKLDGWLKELTKSGLIETYEHGGIRYFYLPGFVKHQVINKAKPSGLPVAGPSAERIETVAVPDSDGTKTVAVRASRARGGSGTERNGTEETPPAASGGDEESPRSVIARRVFAHWQDVCQHPTAKFTNDRRSKVEARLREGYPESDLIAAVDGAARAPFVNAEGKTFDDLELICRTGSKVEDFMRRTAPGRAPAAPPTPVEFSKYDRATRPSEAA